MHRTRFIPVVAVLLLSLSGCLAASTDMSVDDGSDRLNETRTAHLVHKYLNEQRAAHGRAPLEYDPTLAEIAANHSRAMAARGQTSHRSAAGLNVTERYDQAGYQCDSAQRANRTLTPETVGTTQIYTVLETTRGQEFYNTERELAQGIVTKWMQSERTRERLLHSDWRVDGVGVQIRDDDTVYVTQDYC
jgi:uncharacterized protein YkwD